MNTILLASGNKGKLKEMRALLASLPINLVTPHDLNLGNLKVEEVGKSYAENAKLKALAFAQASNCYTLADDSGLEVDVLQGAPGVYSARYSPKPGATDADRRAYLLEQVAGFEGPWRARFCCVIALAEPSGAIEIAEGFCDGEIIPEELGFGGFGYDPIFWLPDYNRTMAELTPEETNTISHRAKAIQVAKPKIERFFAFQ